MFWLILIVVGIVLSVSVEKFSKSNYNSTNDFFIGMGILTSLISFCIFLFVFFNGISDYPCLKKKEMNAKSLQRRIVSIRSARYECKSSQSQLIAGSVENMKQSQVLSQFIGTVAKAEADYNKNLENSKIFESDPILWWFFDGAFISSKIHDLKLIGVDL